MAYTGIYINLDRSVDRRAEMESQLARLGLDHAYRRFVAADGNSQSFPDPALKNGEMGCFTSHYMVLKENLGNPQALHIVEDDVIFAASMKPVIDQTIASGALDGYDIIYTDTTVPTSNSYFKTYKNLFDLITKRNDDGRVTEAQFQTLNMQDKHFGTTSSFLVNPKSIRKIHDLYHAELTRGAAQPIDLFLLSLTKQNVLKVGCVFPFVTSVRLVPAMQTTIEARDHQLTSLALNIARYSFFVDRDLAECRRTLQAFLPLPEDAHLQILMYILGLSFTDSFSDI